MSYSLIYYPDPGIAYDIVKMLIVKLNAQNTWSSMLTTVDSQNEHISFIQQHADLLPDPKPELLLYVYLPSNKSITFLTAILTQIISHDFATFSLSKLLSYFENTEQVQNDLFSYFLGNQSYTNVDLEHLIRHNKYIPDKIKILLFGFSLNPSKYISYLSKTISTYYDIIKEEWMLPHSSYCIPNEFINLIAKRYYPENPELLSTLTKESISYSLSFTTPEFLLRDLLIAHPFFITTIKTIEQTVNDSDVPMMDKFIHITSALSDKQRVTIINQMICNNQMTIQEIASILNLSKTAVIHHMSILKKVDLITTTRVNRKIVYQYNSKGLHDLQVALLRLTKGDQLV